MHKLLSFLLAGLLVFGLAAPVSAQILYEDGAPAARSLGPRIGIGGGGFLYSGPDYLDGTFAAEDVTQTSPAVALYGIVPFADQFAFRAMAGVAGIGQDAPDLTVDNNPFLESTLVLIEGHFMGYLANPRFSSVAPYAYAGVGTVLATESSDRPGVKNSFLTAPVGVGIEFAVSPALSFFVDAGYRFGLTSVSDNDAAMATAAVAMGPTEDEHHCDKFPGKPECTPNGGGGSSLRANAGLLTAGVLFGFGGSPPPAIIPPVRVERETVIVEIERPEVEVEIEETLVCDLVELNSVFFSSGSALLSREARSRLDENVEMLLESPECCVFIDGYVDTTEDDRYGIRLAERRARAVYQYYIDNGISRERLSLRERTVAMPPCDKEDPGDGCRQNRRVDSIPLDCERFEYLRDRH